MSESKHTPGPWQYEFGHMTQLGIRYWQIHDGSDAVACNQFCAATNNEEVSEANARLIAAAPDLLAMLKVAQLWLDVDGRFDMQGINAAIAKAEGR